MYFKYKLNRKAFESNQNILTGRQILTKAGLEPVEDYELLYKVNEKGFVPIQLDESINLETAGIEGFKATPYHKQTVNINNRDFEVEDCFLTPIELLELAGINPDRFYLVELRPNNAEVSYKDDVNHKITLRKKSKFFSRENTSITCIIVNAEVVDWTGSTISFQQVVKLAKSVHTGNPNTVYTVNYINGIDSKPEGVLTKGQSILVNNKMIFNVIATNRS